MHSATIGSICGTGKTGIRMTILMILSPIMTSLVPYDKYSKIHQIVGFSGKNIKI